MTKKANLAWLTFEKEKMVKEKKICSQSIQKKFKRVGKSETQKRDKFNKILE